MTLKRIFGDYAYGDGPRAGCWWDHTSEILSTDQLDTDTQVDIAVIGGGFTGVSSAYALAQKGVRVAVLEAKAFGWGASGRNGGFCCLGGGIASDARLDALYGKTERLAFRRAEKHAVEHVDQFLNSHGIDVDRHSNGETEFAHRPKDMAALEKSAEAILENYGVEPEFIDKRDLADRGMNAGPFFGAMTVPIGFGLNPQKYLAGLISAALASGAELYSDSPVLDLSRRSGKYLLKTPRGNVIADQVIVATNGYSSENIPTWLAGRFVPVQSTVMVTRPLAPSELGAQGWTTSQMSFDTRHLLHYFRLMPDRRFLFGMRGGLITGSGAEAAARAKIRSDFEKMFPAWSKIPTTNSWSGMVNLARNKIPFVGPIPNEPGLWAAMCYHGNGVAMGSYAGQMIADLLFGCGHTEYPDILQKPLARFPFGRFRRIVMPPIYAALKIRDRF